MGRHRFGSGVYKYFDDPLPAPVGESRERLYPPLAGIADTWAERLRGADRYPDSLAAFLERCHAAGQCRPTPLISSATTKVTTTGSTRTSTARSASRFRS